MVLSNEQLTIPKIDSNIRNSIEIYLNKIQPMTNRENNLKLWCPSKPSHSRPWSELSAMSTEQEHVSIGSIRKYSVGSSSSSSSSGGDIIGESGSGGSSSVSGSSSGESVKW